MGGSGWGILVNPWLIHANVWQNPLQYCKVKISLIHKQLIIPWLPELLRKLPLPLLLTERWWEGMWFRVGCVLIFVGFHLFLETFIVKLIKKKKNSEQGGRALGGYSKGESVKAPWSWTWKRRRPAMCENEKRVRERRKGKRPEGRLQDIRDPGRTAVWGDQSVWGRPGRNLSQGQASPWRAAPTTARVRLTEGARMEK